MQPTGVVCLALLIRLMSLIWPVYLAAQSCRMLVWLILMMRKKQPVFLLLWLMVWSPRRRCPPHHANEPGMLLLLSLWQACL